MKKNKKIVVSKMLAFEDKYNKNIEDYCERLVETYLLRANNRMFCGLFSLALEDYNRAIALDDTNVKAFHNRAIFYEKSGSYVKALSDYEKVYDLTSSIAVVNGNAYDLVERVKKKIESGVTKDTLVSGFEEELTKCNKNILEKKLKYEEVIKEYIKRGGLYNFVGNYEDALKDYDRAVELNPSYLYSYVKRGELFKFLEKNKEAESDFTKFIELYKNNTDKTVKHCFFDKYKEIVKILKNIK